MSGAELVLVAAVDSKRGVGRGGIIPWHLPDDLRRLRALTLGGFVCYGRNTWESLPAAVPLVLCPPSRWLEGRTNVLLTSGDRPQGFQPEGLVCRSVKEALAAALSAGKGPLFVLGGARAWEEAAGLSRPALFYRTRVFGDFGCDAFFPVMQAYPRLEGFRLLQDGPLVTSPSGVRSSFQIFSNF